MTLLMVVLKETPDSKMKTPELSSAKKIPMALPDLISTIF